MRRKQSCEDLHKSYSFTHNKVSAKPNKWMQSNEQRSISETPLHQMPQHIARAHTAEDMYNKQDLDDHDRALIALQESLKATSKSRSKSDNNLHRHTITMQRHHGIQSDQRYRRPRRLGFKALALLGITDKTTEQTGSRSGSSTDDDNDDDIELDDTDTLVWMDDDDETDTKRMCFSNITDAAEELTINIDLDDMDDDTQNDDDDEVLRIKQAVRKGKLTPLQSLEMLQRNSLNSSNAPKMPRAASYDLGTMADLEEK
eukprot:198700_1